MRRAAGLDAVDPAAVARAVGRDGYALLHQALAPLAERLLAQVEALPPTASGGRRAGVRDLFRRLPGLEELLQPGPFRRLVDAVLGRPAFAVRALLFDKTPQANWSLHWHQDVFVAVRERHDVPGFRGWSVKHGVPHVLPPAPVLSRMLAARLHLDPCGSENGPLRVIPGSHRAGVLEPEEIGRRRESSPAVECATGPGGLLLLRPLLLHSSPRAASPDHRRVIHLEFAAEELPPPLQWYERH